MPYARLVSESILIAPLASNTSAVARVPCHAQVLPAFLAAKVRRALTGRSGPIAGYELVRWDKPFDLSDSQQTELREQFIKRTRATSKELWPLRVCIRPPENWQDRLAARDASFLGRLLEHVAAERVPGLEVMSLEQVKAVLRVPLEPLLGFLARVEALDWVAPPAPIARSAPAAWVRPTQERVKLTDELRSRAESALRLPWVASLSPQDPRLLHLSLPVSPTEWAAGELERDSVSPAFVALVDQIQLFEGMAASEETRSIVEALAWRCTPKRAAAEDKARWTNMFLRRTLSRQGAGNTLKDVGDEFGLTRERVRQICERFEAELRETQVVATPALDRVLAAAGRVAPVEVAYAEEQLARFIGDGAGLECLIAWAIQLKKQMPVICERVRSYVRGGQVEVSVLRRPDEAPWVHALIRHVRRDQSMLGCSNILRMAGLLAIHEEVSPGLESLTMVLEASPDFKWLEKESGWFTWGDSTRCAAATRVRKVLAVAQDTVGTDEIVGALASDDIWLYREQKGLGLAMPPVHVFRELCKTWPWVKVVQKARLAPLPDVDYSDALNETERRAVALITSLDGIACRFEISEHLCTERGTSDMLVSTTLGSSPVIQRIEHGLYSVRGRRIGDQALANARARADLKAGRPLPEGQEDGLAPHEFMIRITAAALRNEQYGVPARFQPMMKGMRYAVRGEGGQVLGDAWVTGSNVLKGLNRLFPTAAAGDAYRIALVTADEPTITVALSPREALGADGLFDDPLEDRQVA